MELDGALPVVVIIAVVVLIAAAGPVRHWRRGRALREHAQQHGWQPIDGDAFAELVLDSYPGVAGNGGRPGRGSRVGVRGPHVSLGGFRVQLGGGSDVFGRNAHVAPVDGGEVVLGDVVVRTSQPSASARRGAGRRTSTERRGALAARLPGPMPTLKLSDRSLLDRFRRDDADVPEELSSRFRVDALDDEARQAFVDTGAWRAVLEDEAEVEGVVVDGEHLLVVSGKPLTPARATALAGAARQLVASAPSRGAEPGSSSGAALANPLA